MPFVNFWKKCRFFSFDFRQNFDVRTFPRWLSIRKTKFFWWAIQKFFSSKSSLFENIACICWAYAETILSHAEHTRNWFHHTLSIRGTNFRACSASCKMWTVFTCTIHALHTRNELYRILSIRGTNSEMFKSRISRPNRIRFSKISCYRPLGPCGFGFCKKKYKKISCLCTFKITRNNRTSPHNGPIKNFFTTP